MIVLLESDLHERRALHVAEAADALVDLVDAGFAALCLEAVVSQSARGVGGGIVSIVVRRGVDSSGAVVGLLAS